MPSRGSCCASPFQRCGCPPGPRGPAGPAGPSAELVLDGATQDQTGVASSLTPLTVPTLLNSTSPLFTGTGGQLKYIGDKAKTFTLHGQILMQWIDSTVDPAGTLGTFVMDLLIDGTPITTSSWVEVLTRVDAFGDRPFNFHGQRLALLNPNAVVQLGIYRQAGGASVETMLLYGFSLIAAAA